MKKNTPDIIEEQSTVTPDSANGLPTPDVAPLTRNKYADKMNKTKHKLPKQVKIGILAVLVVCIAGGGTFLIQKIKNDAKKQYAATDTAVASRGMLETYVECSGQTAAKNKAELGKDLKGEVTDVRVKEGDSVHVGDVLFVVNPQSTQKDLDAAKTELQNLQRGVDNAAKDVNTAQKNVNYLNITAPFSGKMIPITKEDGTSTSYKAGQDLSSGTVLGTLVDDTTMRLQLYFSYAYVDSISVGASATVSIPASMSSISGKVSEIERVQKVSDDGAVLFRVIISMNNPGTLKKDMVATASVNTSSGTLMPSESGTLEYLREEEVSAKTSGQISTIGNIDYFRYTAGQTICRLKSDEAVTAVETAARALDSAQKNLTDKQTQITELEKLIAQSTVLSPMDGVVTSMTVAVGDSIEAGVTRATVADLTNIVVKASIAELDIDKVKSGMLTTVSLNDENGTQFTGTVESVSLQAAASQNNGNSGGSGGNSITFPAVIQVDAGETPLLPDRFVNVRITTASNPDCIIVPSSAVVYTEQGAAVFALPSEGQTFDKTLPIPENSDVPANYVLVPVEVGISDSSNIEITSGIDEGVTVFLAGPLDPFSQDGGISGSTAIPLG